MDEKKEYVFKEEFLEETRVPEGRGEALVRFLFIQAVVCAMIVITALMLKLAAPQSYLQIKKSYTIAVSESDITFSDIAEFFKGLFSIDKGTGGDDSSMPSNVTKSAYVLSSPITAVCKGTVTSEFGERIHPITKKDGFHTGIDIANKKGIPISAAFSGSIQEVGTNEAYGNYILMRHSENLYTFYGHLDSFNVRKGMNIRRGEVIAFMGTTGYSTGPHLHFEIRIEGIRVDPSYVLKGIDGIEF